MALVLDPVKVATLTNTNISTGVNINSTSIDGVIVGLGDRILIKSQTDKVENGIYVVGSGGTLTRATDFAASATQSTLASAQIFVQQGSLFKDTGWVISNDGNFTVGTSEITFTRFSVSANIVSDVSSYLTLRSEKGYPLTNDELDNNFKYLANEIINRVHVDEYEPNDVRDKINSLSASQANLDAWKLQGKLPSVEMPVVPADSIPVRTSDGEINAVTFIGDLQGNADTADLADFATLAGNVTGIVAVTNGGTGASTAANARLNLGAVNKGGDTLTGKLIFLAGTGGSPGIASFNIPSGLAPQSPSEGDVWATTSAIQYRLNSKTETIAPLDSPTFTGAPTAPTPSQLSNSTSIATTEFVQGIKNTLNAAIALKAPIDSPNLTGTPQTSIIGNTTDDSQRIPTTAFVQDIRDILQGNIDLKAPINSPALSGTPLTSTIGNTTDDSQRISTTAFVQDIRDILQADINTRAIATNVYSKANIDALIALYSTTAQMNSAIANALSNNVYTKTQSDNRYYQKADVYNKVESDDRYYSKTQANTLFDGYYTKIQSDDRYYQKSNVYTKTESNDRYYTKTEINNALGEYATKTYVNDRQDMWGSSKKFVQSADPGSAPNSGDFWFKI